MSLKINSRRNFITESAKGAIALSIGISTAGNLISSCSSIKKVTIPSIKIPTTGFNQQPLPYSYNALENVIDSLTMEIHYSKHAAAYTKNLKDSATAEAVDITKPLENVLANISKYSSKMRNNGGGHYNHELFWQCMRPKNADNKPTGKLAEAIEKTFTSFADFKTQFADAGKNRFGSGWAWLYADTEKNLKIGSTPNQDNPLMDISDIKGTPLLALDVWEHAYYLKYQNKRADYIENWWQVVNWDFISGRFAAL